MASYECLVCGYIYDPKKGDPKAGIQPGMEFNALPDDWICPECGVEKDQFAKVQ
ncbi:MAG: rubredoxin [Methanoregula sp.]